MEPLVPVNLSIKNAPDDVVQRLRERAARNHRSLQGELMAIIDDAVRPQPARYLTVHAALAKVRELNLQQPDEAAALVRADRDSGHADHRDQGC
jgi:antitoxin FitA